MKILLSSGSLRPTFNLLLALQHPLLFSLLTADHSLRSRRSGERLSFAVTVSSYICLRSSACTLTLFGLVSSIKLVSHPAHSVTSGPAASARRRGKHQGAPDRMTQQSEDAQSRCSQSLLRSLVDETTGRDRTSPAYTSSQS